MEPRRRCATGNQQCPADAFDRNKESCRKHLDAKRQKRARAKAAGKQSTAEILAEHNERLDAHDKRVLKLEEEERRRQQELEEEERRTQKERRFLDDSWFQQLEEVN